MKRVSSRWIQLLRWGIGLILLIIVVIVGDVSKLKQLQQSDSTLIVLALCVTGVNLYLFSWRWSIILKQLDPFREYPAGFFWRATVFGNVSNFIGISAVGMGATKLLMLKTLTPVPLEPALLSVSVEHLLDLLLLPMVGLPAIAGFLHLLTIPQTGLLMIGGITLFIILVYLLLLSDVLAFFTRIYRYCLNVLKRLPWFAKPGQHLQTLPEMSTFDYKTMTILIGCTVIRFLILTFRSYLVARALRLDMPFSLFFITIPLLQLSSFINITPGGIGIMDVSRYAIFTAFGMKAGDATLYVIGMQVVNTITVLITAGTAYLPARVFHALKWAKSV